MMTWLNSANAIIAALSAVLCVLGVLAGVKSWRRASALQTQANLSDEARSWQGLYNSSKAQLAESEHARTKCEQQIASWEKIAESLRATIAETKLKIDEMERRHASEIMTLVNTIEEKDQAIKTLRATIVEKDALILALKAKAI